jgi:predicted transcriptional regulator
MLKAKHGLSNREIARVLGYTDPWVSQLFRQPWAKERVLKEMNASGGDAIAALLEAEAVNSLFTVIDIRDDPGAPKAVRGAMANSILDRFCGKPTQKIESEVTVRNAKDIEAVDRELEELKKEEARLCGNANN